MKTFAKNNYSKPAPIDDNVIIELDEMWHFLHSKKDRFGFGRPIDEPKKHLIDWECGVQASETFRKMYERLKKWNDKIFFSDRYSVYRDFIPHECLI